MQSMTGFNNVGGGARALTSHSKGFGGMCHCEHSEAMTRGFTLAEVLITLAIIGVVAALTIPTLVTNYQQRGWNTAATVFERKLEESLKIMNTQGTLAGYKTTEEFVSELSKYLKTSKICKNNELSSCFVDKITWNTIDIQANNVIKSEYNITSIKTSEDMGHANWNTNVVGLQLANGTNVLLAYNPKCTQNPYSNQISAAGCIAVIYDISGYAKPNNYTKDIRSINTTFANACSVKIGSNCYSSPFQPNPLTRKECEEQKGTIGIKDCAFNEDYLAGAASQCGNLNKLPSRAELAEIANYLYNTTEFTETSKITDLYRDEEKASLLGATYSNKTAYCFYLWSNVEVNYGIGYDRYYCLYTSDFYALRRDESSREAMCRSN